MRSVIMNHCQHCGKDFTRGCVGGLTICDACADTGHKDTLFTFRDCDKCVEQDAQRMQRSKIGWMGTSGTDMEEHDY